MERARTAGVQLQPTIEVESLEAAVGLAAQGLGGTFVLQSVADEAAFLDTLRTVPFNPSLFDTFAFVWREGTKLSPPTREPIGLAEL